MSIFNLYSWKFRNSFCVIKCRSKYKKNYPLVIVISLILIFLNMKNSFFKNFQFMYMQTFQKDVNIWHCFVSTNNRSRIYIIDSHNSYIFFAKRINYELIFFLKLSINTYSKVAYWWKYKIMQQEPWNKS